jgi:hypothetical protein
MMLVLEACRVMKASTQISKESLGDQPMCTRVEFPAGSPAVLMCEAMRVKPKMQKKHQEVRGVRNMECLPKESHRQQVEPAQKRSHVGCKW